jgi:hypothetical protein
MEEFEIKDLSLKNLRLRSYDPKLKAKMAVYDHWDHQLHKLLFYNYMDILVETKTDDE